MNKEEKNSLLKRMKDLKNLIYHNQGKLVQYQQIKEKQLLLKLLQENIKNQEHKKKIMIKKKMKYLF